MMRITCPFAEDYSPCFCQLSNDGFRLSCESPVEDNNEIFKLTTPADFDRIKINSHDSVTIIFKDIFVFHRINQIIIGTLYDDSTRFDEYSLQIHPEAFSSSRDFTTEIRIEYHDLRNLSFAFLLGFNQLTILKIDSVLNVNISTLPLLPSLSHFSITRSTGLIDWFEFPILLKGLDKINLYGNNLDFWTMEWILTLFLERLSNNTLTALDLTDNVLNRIPSPIKYFSGLKHLILKNCQIFTIEPHDLKGYYLF